MTVFSALNATSGMRLDKRRTERETDQMIHMLSRFDLNPDVPLEEFCDRFHRFTDEMRKQSRIMSSGRIGRRIPDTPMDTDAADAPAFYVIMTFKDRAQLDGAYRHLLEEMTRNQAAHFGVHAAVRNATFTCWDELD